MNFFVEDVWEVNCGLSNEEGLVAEGIGDFTLGGRARLTSDCVWFNTGRARALSTFCPEDPGN